MVKPKQTNNRMAYSISYYDKRYPNRVFLLAYDYVKNFQE